MAIPLNRISIPADGPETVIWLHTTCDLSDIVFYHKIRLFVLLDKPPCSDRLPRVGALIQSHMVRYQCKQDLVF